MKIVMVNDCAFVGDTLIRYFPQNVEFVHLKRSRGFLDKTFGIAWKILRSYGDVYHIHYLLQDCYIALKLGKRPVIGHAHGSDLRSSIKHFAWSRIVRFNVEKCDKIIVSTPNLLEIAKKFNESAEYIPNLVNATIFYPKPRNKIVDRIKVLVAGASDWEVKGTDKVIRALKKIENEVDVSIISYGVDANKTLNLAKQLGLRIKVLPPVPHVLMPKYYWSAHSVVASIGVGGTLGMVALEAIACGRPVVAHVSSKFSEYKDFPLLDVFTIEEIADAVLSSRNEDLWKREFEYFQFYHDPKKVTKKFMKIYNDLVKGGRK